MVELPEPPELPVELPELDPEPMLPLEEPPLEPVLGELGEVVVLPLVPPVDAPAPDLLKCASHSERVICPSLFVSTDEKLGAAALLEPDMPLDPPEAALPPAEPPEVALPPDAALPPEDEEPELPEEPLDMPDEPLELPPAADGEEDDGAFSAPVVLDDELCATATPDSANIAAAVAALNSFSFNMNNSLQRGWVLRPNPCKTCTVGFHLRQFHPAYAAFAAAERFQSARRHRQPIAKVAARPNPAYRSVVAA